MHVVVHTFIYISVLIHIYMYTHIHEYVCIYIEREIRWQPSTCKCTKAWTHTWIGVHVSERGHKGIAS